MRQLHVSEITQAVRRLCISANKILPQSLQTEIHNAAGKEASPIAKQVLLDLERNLEAAKSLDVPICQDTGIAVVFLEVGQEVHLTGGNLNDAVNEGIRQGYTQGLLRKSIVSDPLLRVNTNDNTPGVIHTTIVDGDKVTITVAPKGCGSENMSSIKMLTPSSSEEDVVQFVVDTVSKAGSNPCPPIVVGVGIGGDFEMAALLSKKALCRDVAVRHPEELYRRLEGEMLTRINELGIGAQGFGGTVTALAVNIETYPTHIASLPVAVNIGCHVTRHKQAVL